MLRVGEIMKTDVATINQAASVKDAAEKIASLKIGSLLAVDDDDAVVGIVTGGDIVVKVVAKDKVPHDVRVKDIMTKKLVVIGPEALIEEAADLMNKYKIKKLPVMVGDKIVGIVTARELLGAERKIIERLTELFPLIEIREGAGE